MKNKNEICVPILNEAELQQAREILERNGEVIFEKEFIIDEDKFYNYLFCDGGNEWWLATKGNRTKIPISELESVLRGESESKYQSSIEWLVSLLKTDEEKEIARKMHREEIEDAFENGQNSEDNNLNPEKYYNETFKND